VSPISSRRPLTAQETKDLAVLLQVAKDRGIELPKDLKTQIADKKTMKWPIAKNGYFIRDDGKFYEPSPAQEGFIKSTARNVLFYGPRGCGKSGAGAQKALFKIMAGEPGLIMNPDFENLKISTWPELKRWIPWGMVVPSQRNRKSNEWQPSKPFTMVFLNGAVVYIKGGKEAGSTRGPNVNWFWFDEGGRDNVGTAWQLANASVRIGKNPQAWCTETPRPTEHWSYKFFIDQDIPEELKQQFQEITKGDRILVEYFHATREDNLRNLDEAYYINLALNYPGGHFRAQEFDGEFANEGGKIGDRAWFKDKVLEERKSSVIKRVRFWDLAATEKKVVGVGKKKKEMNDPDESVGTLLSSFFREWDEDGKHKKDTNWCIEDQVAGKWEWDDLLKSIVDTARHDGPDVPIVLEEEPGSGGKNQVAAVKTHIKRFPELASIQVIGQRARDVGDRVMAANHWFSLAAQGKMWMVRGIWNEKFLTQLDGFTQILHDDRVTSVTGAITYIRPFKSWSRTPFISL
jgi:predicted phage terminase large subunit-like protein